MKWERRRKRVVGNHNLPSLKETIKQIKASKKISVYQLLKEKDSKQMLLFQPRCGVGKHSKMLDLLSAIEKEAQPDILTITIDSYTRLKKFSEALKVLNTDPSQLNGYPLPNHGYLKGQELNNAVLAPVQIRHGSPDARLLFEYSLAAGFTSFEGGGIGYNLPYCKDVPLQKSLEDWSYIDQACGELAKEGIIIDRELFGTLTAVLIPPSISLAITMLEAILAANDGVKCISIAYPQGGNVIQDVAALKCIRTLAAKYLPDSVEVYPVLHEFMGLFPKSKLKANSLIFYGALTAKLGGATKIITKTNHEAYGIPTADANIEGLLTAKMATNKMFEFIKLDETKLQEEMYWIEKEVDEILSSVLVDDNLLASIVNAFEQGTLDIPFSTSRYAHSKIIPIRDKEGAIRYFEAGNLTLSKESLNRNKQLIATCCTSNNIIPQVDRDIHYFS